MIYLDDFLDSTQGQLYGPIHSRTFTNFCFDSRRIQPGELFLAVKTERGDGHDYILDACRDGATGVVCERPVDLSRFAVTCLVVPDTQQALQNWAHHILVKYGTQVVGVTGSVGKTSTKEAVAAVLSARFEVFRNRASFNGRFGLPIALGELRPNAEIAVLEMAADGFGEIAELVQMAPPRVGIVTAVQPAHLDTFGSLEAIAAEKAHLVEGLSASGLAVLNYDDPRVRAMARRTPAQVLTYGFDPGADLVATNVTVDGDGTVFKMRLQHLGVLVDQVELRLPLVGRHQAYVGLAAAAVGLSFGLDLATIARQLAGMERVPGRLNPLPGHGGSLLLDDTYNASPAAVLAALETLAAFKGRRKIAVLGDMTHLGAFEAEGHRAVGRRAAEVVDILVTKGEAAWQIADEARRLGLDGDRVVITYTTEDAVSAIRDRLGPGDVVLVKGAVEARMEEVVAQLMADPAQAERVLVRQEPAWKQTLVLYPDRPTWVEIDLGAIAHNTRRLKALAGPGVKLMAVLKADAYGHGALRVGQTMLNNGADWLAIAMVSEAIALRQAGIDAPILVLGYTPAWQARDAVRFDLALTVFNLDVARALSRAAVALNRQARVHVKVDTGMGRLGLFPEEVVPFIQSIRDLPGLVVEGIFTHFAVADSREDWADAYTAEQVARFQAVLDDLIAAGITIPLVHAANSAATLRLLNCQVPIPSLPAANGGNEGGGHWDLVIGHSSQLVVRPGIALYGLDPSPEVRCPPDFRPALSWKTQIAQVKAMPPGSYIGYGCTYRTEGMQRIAVIPVGYADGFRRAPKNWGEVIVRGRRVPIVGRVCMDQTMIDVTGVPDVRQGDEVVLIGRQGDEVITVEEVAARLGTINYEVVSEILARVPRVS